MKDRDKLIDSFVSELAAKPRQFPVLCVALLWWLLSWAYVVFATHLMGPLRDTVHHQLLHAHQFQLETAVGFVASLLVALAAWYGSTPGLLTRRLLLIGAVASLVWILFYVFGLFAPALEPSMHGKREHCYYEAFIYSVPPTLVACFLVAKRYPLKPRQTGLLIGLAAGMIPALYMQLSCMYIPIHILKAHILPGLLNGIVGLLLYPLIAQFIARRSMTS